MSKWLPFALSMSFASVAFAEPPPPTQVREATSALVQKELVQPLAKKERKRAKFSRSSPPKARRVRVLDAVAQVDAAGKHFVRFAVDAQYPWVEEDGWEMDQLLGCAYLDRQQVFIQSGDEYVPARVMLGADDEPVAGVCQAAPAGEPQAAEVAEVAKAGS